MSYQRAYTLGLKIELLAILWLPRIVCCVGMVEPGRKESPAECHGASRRLANHIFTLLQGFRFRASSRSIDRIDTGTLHHKSCGTGLLSDLSRFLDAVVEYDVVKVIIRRSFSTEQGF